jgi:predicted transcriptional regulator
MSEAERADLDAALEEGLAQADRGEAIPWADFEQYMRQKYGIQR